MHSLEEILTVQIEQEGSQIAQVAIDCTKTQIQRWIESAPKRVSPRSLCIVSCSRTTSLSSRGHQLIRWPTNFHKSPTLSPSLLFFWTLCYYFTSSADCTILSLPLGFPSPCLLQMNERERVTTISPVGHTTVCSRCLTDNGLACSTASSSSRRPSSLMAWPYDLT